MKPVVNGRTRYGTRTQTGTAKRKHYNHSDSGEELEVSGLKHRKRVRRKVKSSSEEDEAYRDNRKPQQHYNTRTRKHKSSSDSDTEEEDDETDTDTESSDDSKENSSDKESPPATTRGRRGGSRPFPIRQPPPLLSSRDVHKKKSIGHRELSPSPTSNSRSSQRFTRGSGGVSYSRYFEDEDDVAEQSTSTSRRSTRSKRPVRYEEDSDYEIEDLNVSISSRGRIRRPNSRMRAFLGE